MFEIRGLVCVVADHLTAGEIYRWAQADARVAVLLGYKPDGRWVSEGGTAVQGIWSRVRSLWPKKICDALSELLRPWSDSPNHGQCYGSVCASGSLLLHELMRDEHGNYPPWQVTDLDLFGACTPATIAGVRDFLNAIREHVWAINKADSCFPDVRELIEYELKYGERDVADQTDFYKAAKKNLPAQKAHDQMMAPIDEFEMSHYDLFYKDRDRAKVKSSRYSKHLPTVNYAIVLGDPATRSPYMWNQNGQNELAFIDIILIADPTVVQRSQTTPYWPKAHGTGLVEIGCRRSPAKTATSALSREVREARLFDWISTNFDFDICANALFGKRLHCRHPSSIFTKQAHFRPDQYCRDVDEILWKQLPKNSLKFSKRTNPPRHVSGLDYCRCRDIICLRVEKYKRRGFDIIIDPAKDVSNNKPCKRCRAEPK